MASMQSIESPVVIEELDLLHNVLKSKEAQRGLITLYSQSQSECTRDGKCGMEIGMAREKDQGAILQYFLGDFVHLDIDNDLPEDYRIGDEKISAKHSSAKVGTPVKAKWTSADESAKDAVQAMIAAEDSYYPNLLLTYLETANNKVTLVCITAEHNRNVIKEMREEAFKIPKGNSRGIEYSTKAMKALLAKKYFMVEITDANVKGGMNPIERRMNMLRTMGINPALE